MAENVEKQKEFVTKQFEGYTIKKTDNAQEKGVLADEKFPTDMLISDGKKEIALQFTELQSTKYYLKYRVKNSRYANKSIEEFLKIFINDKLKFSWDDSVSLFDENLWIHLLPYLASNNILVEDIELNAQTKEEWDLSLALKKQINKSDSFEEIKEVFVYIFSKFRHIVLVIKNRHDVTLNFRIRESHFLNIPSVYVQDFMPAYSSDIKSGLQNVLSKKNLFKTSEKMRLESNGITRNNHYLICQLAEWINNEELHELKDLKIQSDKYSKIIITYDNASVCEIITQT